MDWKKNIAYVKNERSNNLNAMIIFFKFIIKYEVLGLDEIFQSIYFGHASCLHVDML
jgi:hypothetical protein